MSSVVRSRAALSLVAGLVFAALTLAVSPAAASPGDLDPHFAGDGLLEIGGTVYSLEPTARGGFLLARDGTGAELVAFTADGRRDTGFGVRGSITIPNPEGSANIMFNAALGATRHRGGWVVSVIADTFSGDRGWLTRVTSAGQLNIAFGNQGYAPITGRSPRAVSLAVDRNDRILAAVLESGGRNRPDVLSVRRFLPDGAIDTSYGVRGTRRIAAQASYVSSFVLTPSGGVLVAYNTYLDGSTVSRVVRLDSGGRREPTFANRGTWDAQANGVTEILLGPIHLLADGRIVATGSGEDGRNLRVQFAVRLDRRGRIDTTFGQAGTTVVSDPIWSLDQGSSTLDASGRIYLSAVTFNQTAITRLDRDGQIDRDFGDGSVRTPLPGWVNAWRVQGDQLVLVTFYPIGRPQTRIVRMDI